MVDDLTKIFTLTSIAFVLAVFLTPVLTHFLYKYKLGKNIRNDGSTPIFSKLHKDKQGTPTMGGILIWGTTLFIALMLWASDRLFNITSAHAFNFLTRKETWLPLGAFLGAALVGLLDDVLDIYRMGHKGRGLAFRYKAILYAGVASVGAWWFYVKLGFDQINLPLNSYLSLGWWYIPFFILAVVGIGFAVNQTDGLDGLAGGTLLVAFFSYMIIAFDQGRFNLAALLGVVCGTLLAFLWFNVYPARFFMGDTGSMGLGVLLAIVAFYTNTLYVLPFLGLIFLLEAGSTILQLLSKRIIGRKIFLSSPLHHHFEALGWPETKVTMRFWILSAVSSSVGMIVYFISK